MKFRKEIIIFSLIIIFMLMSAVSAEENITVDDGTNSNSDYIELGSNQGYNENSISENPVHDDNVIDDDENISEGGIKLDIYPGSSDGYDASMDYGFNGAAHAGAYSNKNIAVHKSSLYSPYSRGDGADVRDNEYGIDGMLSNFQSSDDGDIEALNDNIYAEDFFAQTYSSFSEYSDYLNWDSLKNLIEENKIGEVFNSNIPVFDSITINYLKYGLINFMDAGAKYVEFSVVNLIDVDAFLDIFDKIMNSPSTHEVMTNIPSSNYNPMLRNDKYYSNYSDYGFYQDIDLIINLYDLNDEMELFMESDSNISDILIIQDNIELINQTFDLNLIRDVCINSYNLGSDLNSIHDVCINSYNRESDLHSSYDVACWRDAYDNSDKTAEIQSFKFSQQTTCLSSNISQDIQHTFYHMIGCECTNTSFTKQFNSFDNIPKVSEFDTIARAEQEDNHDYVLFKKCNVNSPFIVENTSIFALFGVIEITIP